LKERIRRFIGSRRDRASIGALHRLATLIEAGYENEEWDMGANGETRLIHQLAPARFTTLVDVGAHVGDWSVEALTVWGGSHVHAFEVGAPTYERLQQRIERTGLSHRSTLNGFGLSDRSGTREMYYFHEHPQLTCDMVRHPHATATPFQAQLMEGDEYVNSRGIDSIDFIKIDVEGAEHLVLKGLRKTLEAGRIQCIQFEYGAFSIQTRVLLADYYEMLGSLYWIGKIFPRTVEFRDYDWTMENFRFSNFLCVLRHRPDLKELALGATAGATRPHVQVAGIAAP
jgi:FkbM family methyltransferase